MRTELAPWESYLLRISRLSLSHIRRLATVRVLRDYENLFPAGYLGRLVSGVTHVAPVSIRGPYQAGDSRAWLQ